jgi:catechol 2,3-dioxygenase-like lactoylglutathione lyase family enzyme
MSLEIRGMAPLLSVFDMPTSVRFYRDVLGFEVVSTSARAEGAPYGWALLRHGEVEVMLNTAYDDDQRPATPDASRIESHQDTCLYFGCPDPDGAFEYLRGRGVKLQPPKTAYYGMRQLYVHDPDGYNLCFQWPAEKLERQVRDV